MSECSPSPSSWKLRLALILVCAVLPLGACCCLRIFKAADINAYLEMARECHPVWKQLALRQFGPGDSAKRLFQRFPPTRSDVFGRYGVYSYWNCPPGAVPFSSFGVVTRDGKLLGAGAGGCTWGFTFFNTPDPELDRQYKALWAARYVGSMRRRLEGMGADLQRFYNEHLRWPTNEGEFGTFVTGQLPTEPELDPQLHLKQETIKERQFRHRYGLDHGPIPFNPLGIVLNLETNEQMCIAFEGKTDSATVVRKPEL